jgi:hypothetical protein
MNHFRDFTPRKMVNMMSRIMQKRWETSDANRRDALEFVVETIGNENVHPATRVKAVDLLLRMEQQNQIDERVSLEMSGGQVQPQMVLLLPPNGSEVSVGNAGLNAAGLNAAAECEPDPRDSATETQNDAAEGAQ